MCMQNELGRAVNTEAGRACAAQLLRAGPAVKLDSEREEQKLSTHKSEGGGAAGRQPHPHRTLQHRQLRDAESKEHPRQHPASVWGATPGGAPPASQIKMLEGEKDLVAKMLRAVLQSNRDGVALNRVQKEYHALTGEWIPFKQLGYPTLEEYLRSVPSVVRLERSGGEITCFAMVCKETEQIAKLVARQRSSKKRTGGQVNCQMRLKYTSPVTLVGTPKATLRQPGFSHPEMSVQRPVPLMTTNKGAFQWVGKPYSHPAHITFPPGIGPFREGYVQKYEPMANRPERRLTIPPRFQKEMNAQLYKNQSQNQNANNASQEKNKILDEPNNLTVIQNNLKELLTKYSNGIWLSKLPQIFRDAFKQDLDEEIVRQLEKWPHVCTFEKVCSRSTTDVLLYPAGKIKTVEKCQPKNDSNHNQERIPVPALSSKPEPLNKQSMPVHALSSKPEPLNDQNIQTSNESSSSNLKQKIIGLLQKYSSGLWVHALPKVFEDTYKARLPEAVLENLDLLSDICTVDYISDNPQKAIIYARSETNQDVSTTKEDLKSMVDKENVHTSEEDSEENEEIPPPPALVIPSEPSPSVLVEELNNTNEVVIRYVGKDYSTAQECVEDEMKDYYTQNIGATPIRSLSVGQLVAVSAEEDAWLRARVLSVEGERIKVFYVDYGFSEIIERKKTRKLARQFHTLPFQAAKCSMAGLEAFSSDPVLVKSVELKACGKILAVEILQKSDIPVVVLYDTSGDDDININAVCLKDLHDKSLHVHVKVDALYTNVRVTNVCSDGTFFCQIPSVGLAKLCDILQKIENYFQSKITSEFYISLSFVGKTCLFYSKGKLARVQITSVHSHRALDVHLLDSGSITTVKVSDLREIPPQFLRDVITIPPQVLKCCLADLPATFGMWTPDAVLWLRDNVLNCSDCSIKVVRIDDLDGMVHVYLFTPKNLLHVDSSVNHQITNANLWKHQKDVFLSVNQTGASLIQDKGDATHGQELANVGLKKELSDFKKPVLENSFVLCASDLPPLLPLPKPGEHMDVFVSVACHPGHFVFQPWQELHKLEVLMEEMILHYSTAEECPIPVEKNRLYAAKVENKWYRALLKGILANGLVSVYQLDFGRHELVSRRKIQPLIDKFKKLPFQAVTAQLAGVKSDHWSEEASIVFRNHVEKKPLVALVQSVHESADAWNRKVVAYIVDTSLPDIDLWIHYLMSEYLAQ